MNFSVERCVPLPTPACPKLSAPGFAFATATRSATLFTADPTGTTSTLGCTARGAMSMKSRVVSYGSFAYMAGLTECAPELISRV